MIWNMVQGEDDMLNKATSPSVMDLEVMATENWQSVAISAIDILKEASSRGAGDHSRQLLPSLAPDLGALLAPPRSGLEVLGIQELLQKLPSTLG